MASMWNPWRGCKRCSDGCENAVVCCTAEPHVSADRKLSVFSRLPIKHRRITAQPLIGPINTTPYLAGIDYRAPDGPALY